MVRISSFLLITAFAGFACGADLEPVILVHGMKFKLDEPADAWGASDISTRNESIVGYLEDHGYRFEGVIRAKGAELSLPDCLHPAADIKSSEGVPVFAFEFSEGANIDGLAYKTLELADCIEAVCAHTGAKKVQLVTYSVGGLVARAYIQSSLPRAPYRQNVSQLVTICTPHMGATKAEHFGDWLGTRATSLTPKGELIRRLNDELLLPTDVQFTSIVVRGVAIGVFGLLEESTMIEKYVSQEMINRLPLDFRKGGDQVISVQSQNLALSQAAQKYRKASGIPVRYQLVRVPDPTSEDLWVLQDTVHAISPRNPEVAAMAASLVISRDRWYQRVPVNLDTTFVNEQAALYAFGLVEDSAATRHLFCEVEATKIIQLEALERSGRAFRFRFQGWSRSRDRITRAITFSTETVGVLELEFDDFGLPQRLEAQSTITKDELTPDTAAQ